MSITALYTTNPRYNFPRTYIQGFVGSADVTNLALIGNILSFDYLAPLIHVDMRLLNPFYTPSSNCYTLDYVFDWAASQVYLSGSPIAAGVNVGFYVMLTEPQYRIQVLSTFAPKETETADLAQIPNYWRP